MENKNFENELPENNHNVVLYYAAPSEQSHILTQMLEIIPPTYAINTDRETCFAIAELTGVFEFPILQFDDKYMSYSEAYTFLQNTFYID